MKNLLFLPMTLLVLTACNDQTQPPTPENTAKSDTTEYKVQIPNSGCYLYTSGKDTIAFKMEVFPNVVTGVLKYDFYEKDGSKGEIDGKLRGDTLVADYSFMAEGTRSIRQVIFLIQDSLVTEGYGDMEEKEGRMVFKNSNKVDFSKGLKLRKISCQDYDPAHQ